MQAGDTKLRRAVPEPRFDGERFGVRPRLYRRTVAANMVQRDLIVPSLDETVWGPHWESRVGNSERKMQDLGLGKLARFGGDCKSLEIVSTGVSSVTEILDIPRSAKVPG